MRPVTRFLMLVHERSRRSEKATTLLCCRLGCFGGVPKFLTPSCRLELSLCFLLPEECLDLVCHFSLQFNLFLSHQQCQAHGRTLFELEVHLVGQLQLRPTCPQLLDCLSALLTASPLTFTYIYSFSKGHLECAIYKAKKWPEKIIKASQSQSRVPLVSLILKIWRGMQKYA